MTTLADYLAERRRIAGAATEGPWRTGAWRDRTFREYVTIEPKVGSRTIGDVTDNHQGNAAAIVDAHNESPKAWDALGKVLELHSKALITPDPDDGYMCAHCVDRFEVDAEWPCETVRAIADVLGVEAE